MLRWVQGFGVTVQVKSPFSGQLRVTVRILFAVEEAGIVVPESFDRYRGAFGNYYSDRREPKDKL
jgi:hypothetical protein